jgi:hypothetical protein
MFSVEKFFWLNAEVLSLLLSSNTNPNLCLVQKINFHDRAAEAAASGSI